MYHPSRGGVRGGADQFEWESIKSDKHRENYLGHSLKAPVGRWQKNKDLQWFSRDKKGSGQGNLKEKDAIKRMEAEAMAAALGHGFVKKQTQQLTRQELEEVCKKGQTERDEKDIERIEGMGFGSNRASLMDTLSSNTKETLSAVGTGQEIARPLKDTTKTTQSMDIPRKVSKKSKKKEKKEKRKHKKKKSKEQRESKRRNNDSDSSSEEEHNYKTQKNRRRHDSSSEDEHSSRKKPKHRRHDSESSTEDQGFQKRKRHDSDFDHDERKTRGSKNSKTNRKESSDLLSKNKTGNSGLHSSRQRRDSSDRERDPRYSSKTRHDSISDDSDSKRSDRYSRNMKQSYNSSDDDNSRSSSKKKEVKNQRRQRHDSFSDN